MPPGRSIDVVWRRLPADRAGAIFAALLTRLPQPEQERSATMAGERRLAFVTARALLRDQLAARLGQRPEAVPLAVVDDRPVLPASTGLFVSISHSGPIAVCAVADGPVGIDVEAPGGRPPRPSLIRRVCTPDEAALLETAADLEPAFLRLWVRKEAVSKALGQGLDAGFGRIDVRRDTVTVGDTRWQVVDLELAGLPAAVAAPAGDDWSLRVAEAG